MIKTSGKPDEDKRAKKQLKIDLKAVSTVEELKEIILELGRRITVLEKGAK